jgi:phospholipase C
MRIPRRSYVITAVLTAAILSAAGVSGALASQSSPTVRQDGGGSSTATPIRHLVVIFDENISFDHYFGTYPYAANTDGSTFHARSDTPAVNGLYDQVNASGQPTGPLLTANPNGANANPVRLSANDPMTCDQDHAYTAEQLAADHGAEDAYPANTGASLSVTQCLSGFDFPAGTPEVAPSGASNSAVMSYYDGNTVTGLWNYAQHFAMSDNNYGTTYGPAR